MLREGLIFCRQILFRWGNYHGIKKVALTGILFPVPRKPMIRVRLSLNELETRANPSTPVAPPITGSVPAKSSPATAGATTPGSGATTPGAGQTSSTGSVAPPAAPTTPTTTPPLTAQQTAAIIASN